MAASAASAMIGGMVYGVRLAVVLGLAAVPAALAQVATPSAAAVEFDRLWQALAAAPGGAANLAPAAVRAFLQLPAGEERSGRLDRAVAVAHLAGQDQRALDLVDEARRAAIAGPILDEFEVRALIRGGRVREFAARARAIADQGGGAAVLAGVRAEEGALLVAADAALRRGELAAAVFAFERMVQAWPGDPIRLANLALTWRHVGNVEAAAAAYAQALVLAPDDPQILSDQGLFLRATGDWPGAVAVLQRSLAADKVAGEGPAITNLVQMAVLRPAAVPLDPLPAASAALKVRPDAVFLRRVTLDLILDRAQAAAKQPFGKAASSR